LPPDLLPELLPELLLPLFFELPPLLELLPDLPLLLLSFFVVGIFVISPLY
jgi:hypothetical protein